jgi:hypothetical protein
MKGCWGSEGIAPCILDFGTKWKSASRAGLFTPTKTAPCTHLIGGWLDLKAGPGRGGKKKNSQPLLGLEPPDHPARSPALCS